MSDYAKIERIIEEVVSDGKEHSIQEFHNECRKSGLGMLLKDRNRLYNIIYRMKVKGKIEATGVKGEYREGNGENDKSSGNNVNNKNNESNGRGKTVGNNFSCLKNNKEENKTKEREITNKKKGGAAIDWNKFFVLEPQFRQPKEKRFTVHEDGEIRLNSSLQRALAVREAELMVSHDGMIILINPDGKKPHKFTKAGTTKNRELAELLKKKGIEFPVCYEVSWDEEYAMWRGDVASEKRTEEQE